MGRRARRSAPVVLLLALVVGIAAAHAQAPAAIAPIPEVTGPIPVTS